MKNRMKEVNGDTIEMVKKNHPKTYEVMELFISMPPEEKAELPMIIISIIGLLLPKEIRRVYLTELIRHIENSLGIPPKESGPQTTIVTIPDKETTH